jgi:hypothetical protein
MVVGVERGESEIDTSAGDIGGCGGHVFLLI